MNSKPKRVIVISDVHSDYIDQAILILKPGYAQERDSIAQGNFLLREANAIIENYNLRLLAQQTPVKILPESEEGPRYKVMQRQQHPLAKEEEPCSQNSSSCLKKKRVRKATSSNITELSFVFLAACFAAAAMMAVVILLLSPP